MPVPARAPLTTPAPPPPSAPAAVYERHTLVGHKVARPGGGDGGQEEVMEVPADSTYAELKR